MAVYQINEPQVIYEVVDGETVVINLDKGHYYGFEQTGTKIWKMILDSGDDSQISDYFQMNYEGDPENIINCVTEFITALESEELIRKSNIQSGAKAKLSTKQDAEKKELFVKPVFQKFTDMEDLLLLDPIHDVDETGWPSLKDD